MTWKKSARLKENVFPANEAATREIFENRLKFYANHFWLLFDSDNLVSFVDGLVTDEADLTDEMYKRAEMHNENGKWQMIFGVNTIPAYRKKGLAGKLISAPLHTRDFSRELSGAI